MHWSEKYVGKEYIFNEFDCTHLVQEVQTAEFDRYIDLPTERGVDLKEASDLIEKYKEHYGVPTDNPVDGDVILMHARNDRNHIGVLCVINKKKYVLHNLRGRSTCCHKISDLKKQCFYY